MFTIKNINNIEEQRFFSRYVSDRDEDVDYLVYTYFWLGEYAADKYSHLGIDRDYLLDTAHDALLEAASDYAVSRKEMPFSPYALRVIVRRLQDFILAESTGAHRSEAVTTALMRARSAMNNMSNNLKNDVSDWNVAKALGMEEDELLDLIYGNEPVPKVQGPVESSSFSPLLRTSSRISRKLFRKAAAAIEEVLDAYEKEE